jgi:twinkle protein
MRRNRNRLWLDIYMPQLEEETTAIQFPYFRGGEVINVKYRDGRKNFRMAAGAERVLYGLNDISDVTTMWVEGEMDKLALEVAGYPNTVSVPDGAPAPDSKSYESKFDFPGGAGVGRRSRPISWRSTTTPPASACRRN